MPEHRGRIHPALPPALSILSRPRRAGQSLRGANLGTPAGVTFLTRPAFEVGCEGAATDFVEILG